MKGLPEFVVEHEAAASLDTLDRRIEHDLATAPGGRETGSDRLRDGFVGLGNGRCGARTRAGGVARCVEEEG